jgi:opacity protein-like surface antigen
MKKSVCVLAVLAAAVSTSAVAKDLKQDRKAPAPTIAAAQMSDAEMDKVTAAGNAFGHLGPEAWQFNNGNGPKGLALGHLK